MVQRPNSMGAGTGPIYTAAFHVSMLANMAMLIELAVVAFFVARVTRLITTDEITNGLRQTAARSLPQGSPVTYLLFCRWCMSVWVATPTAALWCSLSALPAWSGHWFIDVPTTALALSYATGLLVRAEPEA